MEEGASNENKRKHAFRFKAASDVDLLKEVIYVQPFDAPFGQTKLRWDEVADQVTDIYGDVVTVMCCRKRFDDLMSAFKHDTVKALRASGTEEEYNEREQLLQDISDLITESNDRKQATKDDRINKHNKREVDGELIRSAALGQIKRAFENGTKIYDNGDPSIPEKRQRRDPEPADFMIEFAGVMKASNELKRDEITLAQRKMDLDEARFAYEKAEREARFNLEKGEREIQMKMMMELVKKLNKD
ncbi:unnamed protein product [Aphanomyces euteiches]